MTTMTDELLQRVWEHQRRARFNEKPKSLSLTRDEWVRLMKEADPVSMYVAFGRRRTLYFMGIRIRVRHYERERAKKWHGPGAIQTIGDQSLGSYGS